MCFVLYTASSHEVPSSTQSSKRRLLVSKMTRQMHCFLSPLVADYYTLSSLLRLRSLRMEYEHKKDRQQKLMFLQDLVLKKSPVQSHLDIRVTARNQGTS